MRAWCERVQYLAIGLWGCFFGAAVVMLLGAAVAYARSLRKIAANAAVSAVASSLYVAAHLGLLTSGQPAAQQVMLAWIAIAVSVVLTYTLFAVLGTLKKAAQRLQLVLGLLAIVMACFALQWVLSPHSFHLLGESMAAGLSAVALAGAIYSAFRGDKLAWAAMGALVCMMLAMVGLAATALAPSQASWELLAGTALAATLYLATMCGVLWTRYAYLIELRKVMAYGHSYDPVTKLRSTQETGNMLASVFKAFRAEHATLGVVVLTIGNLYALEQLYGMAAVNNALFVCAGRLKRCVSGAVEMGRLGSDGFVLLLPNCSESYKLVDLARAVEASLRRSVVLNTSATTKSLGVNNSTCVAEIGLGVLMVTTAQTRSADAVAMARRMSRTALSYPSRIAWFDDASGETVDLPDLKLL